MAMNKLTPLDLVGIAALAVAILTSTLGFHFPIAGFRFSIPAPKHKTTSSILPNIPLEALMNHFFPKFFIMITPTGSVPSPLFPNTFAPTAFGTTS